jgi:hypothetical protein
LNEKKNEKINKIIFYYILFIIFLFSLAKKNLIKNTDVVLTNIETLCHGNQTMTAIEEHLQDLLFKFDICKSKFSADSRRLLRQRFSYLAEQCQKRNASNKIVFLTKKLADHAYKSPERM